MLSDRGSDRAAAAVTPVEQGALAELVQGFSTGGTVAFVGRLERRVQRNQRDVAALTLLGFAYQQRARETADTAFLTLSGRALRSARELAGESSLVLSGLASLAISQHRFEDALPLARHAVRLDSQNATAFAALGDAFEGLGRYPSAFQAFDRAAELSPSVATYARVAHGRELLGRARAASAALRIALTLDSTLPEHRAWALVQLGSVALSSGDIAGAERSYRRAIRSRPGYVHAHAGLARVDLARGRPVAAVRRLQLAVERVPYPAYATLLAETLDSLGRTAEARQGFALVRAIYALQRANGVRTDLQAALFEADRGDRPRAALAMARAARAARPSIPADDVLAWALYRNGRCSEAQGYSAQALRLGTKDALAFFHRGMIERCLGSVDAGRGWLRRALELNPGFSPVWSPVAARYAR